MIFCLLIILFTCPRCEILLKQGEIERVEAKCKWAEDEPFFKGEIRFFEGDFDSALSYYNKVSISSHYANDAIFRILLIREIEKESLKIYANAELEISRGNLDKGIDYIREGIALGLSSGGYAGLLLAKAFREKGNLAMAAQSLLDVEELEPDGLFIPYLLKEAGLLYEEIGKYASAREIYERLCVEFPDSPIVPVVRDRMEQLPLEQ